jgi:hypothetical protein
MNDERAWQDMGRDYVRRDEQFDATSTADDLADLTEADDTEPEPARVEVVHCQRSSYDLYIGRPMPRFRLAGSPLGNLFRGPDAIARFREHFESRPDLQEYAQQKLQEHRTVHPGEPFRIACWCKKRGDEPCHGDVVKAFLEEG